MSDTASLDLLLHAAKVLPWRDTGELPSHAVEFLTQVHEALDPNSFQKFRLEDLVLFARDFWRWTDIRPDNTCLVRTRRAVDKNGNPLDLTLLEICGEDMPFIIRSVIGACQELNIHPTLLVHPLMNAGRDVEGKRVNEASDLRESYVQLVLDYLDDDLCDALETEIKRTLDDLRVAVADYGPLRRGMLRASQTLSSMTHIEDDIRAEAKEFLDWLADDNFTFLGSREYVYSKDANGNITDDLPDIVTNSGLGILRDENRYILSDHKEPLTGVFGDRTDVSEQDPIIVSKGTLKSRVHRRVRVDYIGIQTFDEDGQVKGEVRFAGLFTADAYNRLAINVPRIRQKIEQVLTRSGKRPGSHDYSALKNILETYPRDEMFQISVDQLLSFSLAILQLENKNETRVFVRYDRYDRFVSVLVYVSKEIFDSELRAKIGRRLCEQFSGQLSAFYSRFGDDHLARIHYLIDLPSVHQKPNEDRLEEDIAELAESWNDKLRDIVRKSKLALSLDIPETLLTDAFTAAYKESFTPDEAVNDIRALRRVLLDDDIDLVAYKLDNDEEDVIRARIYLHGQPLQLSNTVPVFESMGLFVSTETAYPIDLLGSAGKSWVHVLKMKSLTGRPINLGVVSSLFEDAFKAIWTGKTVSDGFNRLIFDTEFSWREVNLFRALCRYRSQSGLDPAQSVQIEALSLYPNLTNDLLTLFLTKFDPDLGLDKSERTSDVSDIEASIYSGLKDVPSLEHDSVLRRLLTLILATKRTSYYQLDEDNEPFDQIAIKIACQELDALPDPKPYREIFVWAPHVEGLHLRFGPVARGGLRWSDRPNDFRTEVLGLVKAQQVKNAVIVPVGSKGGFFPKQLPQNGSRDDIRAEGVRSYKTFITALLQLTDNIVDGVVRHPNRTLIWEGEDPYLVVAADKGTATFSDIANGISESLGFWLGDAFASGGSVGYDHKKMGITARGAWVAVQRHFRELGTNVQTDPISVVGIGDMSGDVFGNGMLLSKTLNLKAAFNHLHIFLDPNPLDTERSYDERKRLFELPRSTWEDYDPSLISKGGGVFSRSQKSIPVSDEIAILLGIDASEIKPNDLIRAILRANVDLIWFGGIGTYFKSSTESHAEVGDKVNDPIRLNATDIQAKVIGEGANLGLTQKARIEFAQRGGRLNTDAIDNSAGVDSSDHEVNIKILLANAIETGELTADNRNMLLSSMTDDVARLVLQHNYDQTGSLSVEEKTAVKDLDSHQRFITRLESQGLLDRALEDLPSSDEILERKAISTGLTRPELSVLLAYSKIVLFDDIVNSDVPDDPYLNKELDAYFPEQVSEFKNALNAHKLKREIISTRLANDVVNLGGITFVNRVDERTGAEPSAVVKSFVAAIDIFDIRSLLTEIDALDYEISTDAQVMLRLEVVNVLRRLVYWFTKTKSGDDSISTLIEQYKHPVQVLIGAGPDILSKFEHDLLLDCHKVFVSEGTPKHLATKIVTLKALLSATDIVDLAAQQNGDVLTWARVYHAIGSVFQLDLLKTVLSDLEFDSHWDRLASKGLTETLLGIQSGLTSIAMGWDLGNLSERNEIETRIHSILSQKYDKFANYQNLLGELTQAGAWSFAKIVLIANELRLFADQGKTES